MPETVRCDVCGGLFSSRHLGSHKRLAHPGGRPVEQAAESAMNDQEAMRRIVELFDTLSEENKKNLLNRLRVPPGAR